MPEIHAARRGRAKQLVREAGADAALITAGPNVRYLTGLASSNAALLLPADGRGVLATDSRYELAARRDCPDLDLVIGRFIAWHMSRVKRVPEEPTSVPATTMARLLMAKPSAATSPTNSNNTQRTRPRRISRDTWPRPFGGT